MKSEQQFDAVQVMRQIREELNRELAGKSFEEQKRYIRERVTLPYAPEPQHAPGGDEAGPPGGEA